MESTYQFEVDILDELVKNMDHVIRLEKWHEVGYNLIKKPTHNNVQNHIKSFWNYKIKIHFNFYLTLYCKWNRRNENLNAVDVVDDVVEVVTIQLGRINRFEFGSDFGAKYSDQQSPRIDGLLLIAAIKRRNSWKSQFYCRFHFKMLWVLLIKFTAKMHSSWNSSCGWE